MAKSGILETILQKYVDENKITRDQIKTEVCREVASVIGDGSGFTRKLEIIYPDKETVKTISHPHKCLDSLLNLIAVGQDCYLYGPPGTGKSTAAQQVAAVLSLPFSYVSLCPQSSETLLFGFNHAGGGYVETEFYRLYRDGGVFCIDEMDNGNAALLNRLNSLLENGHGSFPCGTIKRHPKFVLVATGNTNGNGGSLEFPDRRAFDPAFKERFAFLYWPLDTAQEKMIAISKSPDKGLAWLEKVVAIRAEIAAQNIERVIVSPRATYKGCELLESGKFKEAEVAEMLIFKGISPEVKKKILAGVVAKAKAGEAQSGLN